MFEAQPIPKGIRDPDSAFSGYWDLTSIVLLLYVSYAVPARIGFSLDVEVGSGDFFWDLCVDIFFITDIFLQFKTAYWKHSGTLEVDKVLIRHTYLRGWFSLDLISSLPLNYVTYFFDEGQMSELHVFKSFRLLRLFKLLRLARLKRLLQKYQDTFDLQPYIGLIMTFGTIVFAAHMMACFWYLVGSSQGSAQIKNVNGTYDTVATHGWVERDILWCDPTGTQPMPGGLVCYIPFDEVQKLSFGKRYIRSMYTAFNAEFAYTQAENAFGVIGTLVTGFIYGGLAGVLSSIMMTQNAGEQEYMLQLLHLKSWMKARSLNQRERRKILAQFNNEHQSGLNFDEHQILESLPVALAHEVSYHLYHRFLENIPIFRNLGKEILNHLCRCVVRDFNSGHQLLLPPAN